MAGDQAVSIANDIQDLRYRAVPHSVPVGGQVPTRSHGDTETTILLEDGELEFMIGGAATCIAAPHLVRVPPGVPHAYRNIGDHAARLLIRASRPAPIYRTIRVCIESAA